MGSRGAGGVMKKLYVLVRKDLTRSSPAVQAGHAVAQWMLQHGHTKTWENETLVYLGIDTEEELERWQQKLDLKNIECVVFKEPDLGDQKTAIACLHEGKIFSNLKLL